MKCTVIIRVLNEKENLYQLINLLETQTNINFELVVIDSGSTDGTVEMLSEFDFKFPFYFTEIAKEEFSFGKALNKAIELSNYKDIVLSISAHCFPVNDEYLSNMTKHFIKEDIGLVYGRQIGDTRSPLSEVNHLCQWFPSNNNFQSNLFCNNGSSAFRYKDWEKILFDEEITGCEDILFSLKLFDNDQKTLYEPNAIVTHFHYEEFKLIYNRYKRESTLIKSLFVHKLYLFQALKSIYFEIKSDLNFRKKQNYPRSNFLEICKYRIAKNFGQYLSKPEIKEFNIDIKIEEKNKLLNHYYYS